LPPVPPIFRLIQRYGEVDEPEMYEVFNMGVGFCVAAAERDCAAILAILQRYGRTATAIGHVVADDEKSVHLSAQGLVGRGKRFRRR
jgi:phosphoribosylformylglycinamidine cyclo-ligase